MDNLYIGFCFQDDKGDAFAEIFIDLEKVKVEFRVNEQKVPVDPHRILILEGIPNAKR